MRRLLADPAEIDRILKVGRPQGPRHRHAGDGRSEKDASGFISLKNVLVTGAAKRLGRAIALDLAARGLECRDALSWLGRRRANRPPPKRAAKGVQGRRCCKADLSREEETAALVARAAEAIGPLTALINSASLFENDDWQSATPRKAGTSIWRPICARRSCCRRNSPSSLPDGETRQHHQHHRPAGAEADAAISVLQPEQGGALLADHHPGAGHGAAHPRQCRGARPHHPQCPPVGSGFRPPARRHHAEARRRARRHLRRGPLSAGAPTPSPAR